MPTNIRKAGLKSGFRNIPKTNLLHRSARQWKRNERRGTDKDFQTFLSGFREQTGNRYRAQYRKGNSRSTSWTGQCNFPARTWFFIYDYSSSKQENLSAEEEENQAGSPLPEDIIPEQNATAAMSQKVLPIMLIVDDNEDMLNFLSSHFQTSYTIVTAVDGVDALNKLKEQEVALIISDWMMPNMNGIDLCKAVRNNQLTSHIPFILLTAKTDTEAKITSMNCGADAYIEKPFSLQYLEACIKNLLELRLQLRQKFSQMPTVSINSIAANQNDKIFWRR